MRIWLDDTRPQPPGYDIHTITAAETIRLLGLGHATEISLDHDLGEEANGTGYDVAKWIEGQAYLWSIGDVRGLPPLQWRIHSQNTVGVGNMLAALGNANRFWYGDK